MFNNTQRPNNNFRNPNYKGTNYNPNYKSSTGVRKPFVKRENTYGYKKNEMIFAQEILLIDEEGKNVGVTKLADAMQRAQELELDLVEIAPNSKPPVCRIVSWDKFRYEAKKKQGEKKQHSVETKVLWIGINSSSGHLEEKCDRALEFVNKRMPVKIEVRAKGGRIPQGMFFEVMKKILAKLQDNVKIDQQPKFEGARRYSIVVSKKI